MLTTVSLIFVVRSREERGERLISAMIKLWSSFGTNPAGVTCNNQANSPIKINTAIKAIHRLRERNWMARLYFFVVAAKPALNAEENLSRKPFRNLFSPCGFNNKAHSAGLKVRAFKAEIRMATASVRPNCL